MLPATCRIYFNKIKKTNVISVEKKKKAPLFFFPEQKVGIVMGNSKKDSSETSKSK